MTTWTRLESPLGALTLVKCARGLAGIFFDVQQGARVDASWRRDDVAFDEERRQLGEYFAGARHAFDLALAPEGTPFQRAVWDELRRIPFGTTIDYATLAARLGNPNASRAVGAANGKNPLSIVVPCHRVIARDGALAGYAGGTWRKAWLLDFERQVIARSSPSSAIRISPENPLARASSSIASSGSSPV